jgi:hypothetical protein
MELVGQYGYSGHVVNLPQDVASCAQNLQRIPSGLDVIIVRKEGDNQSHRDFHVRRAVVHRALQLLVTHNQYYRALVMTIDTTALQQLPQDGNISDQRNFLMLYIADFSLLCWIAPAHHNAQH